MEILISLIKAIFRPFNFGKVKTYCYLGLVTALTWNIIIKVDYKGGFVQYMNSGGTSIALILFLTGLFVFVILIDFADNQRNRKERKKLYKTISKPGLPPEVYRILSERIKELS